MILESIIYLPTLLTLLFLSFALFKVRKTSLSANFFGVVTTLFFIYLLGFYVADFTVNSLSVSKVFFSISVAASTVVPAVFLIFCLVYPAKKSVPYRNIVYPLLSVPTVYFFILSLTNGFASSYIVESGSIDYDETKPAYAYWLIYLIISLLISLYLLLRGYRKKPKPEQSQIVLLLGGIIITVLVNVFLSFVLVYLKIGTYASLLVAPSFLFFVVPVSIAIVKHRLFDIRSAIARSVAYLFSISIIGILFVGIVYALSRYTGFFEGINLSEQLVYIVLSFFIIFIFPYIKRQFDRISNKLFYQDSYDPQLMLGDLNKVLVSTTDIDVLLEKSMEILQKNLKPIKTYFYLCDTSYANRRLIAKGDSANSILVEDVDMIREELKHIKETVISVLPEEDGLSSPVHSWMKKNRISAIVRLVPTLEYDIEGVGYILITEKKSGSILSRTDIRMLEIIANELVIAIQNALRFEEIEKFNITLQQKIDTATKELTKTNEKLMALDEAKDEFVSMASHQLRTPLTSVKGYVSMVLEGDAGKISPMQRQLLEQAFTSSQRMVYLIADLLNVSRLRTGKFVIENKPTDLAEVIEGEAAQLQDTAHSRNLTLTYKKPKKFPVLNLDETKIRQVAMNFMDNAIYYTPAGGKIKVELTATEEAITYKVIDNGIGVPKSQKHHLFSKFYRADNARKARPDGTGLGLFMAKKVIVAQGGSIIFESEEGKGSTFGFTFPRKKLETATSIKDQVSSNK